MADESSKTLKTVGWREWVGLPDLKIRRLKAKIDTGAQSSCIHAYDVEEFSREGTDYVRFAVHPMINDDDKVITVEAELLEYRRVKSSNGEVTNRPVIRTTARMADIQWQIEVTLNDRSNMQYPMLVGREALQGSFVVDVARSYLGGLPQ